MPAEYDQEEPEPELTVHAANIVSQDQVQLEILKFLRDLKDDLKPRSQPTNINHFLNRNRRNH